MAEEGTQNNMEEDGVEVVDATVVIDGEEDGAEVIVDNPPFIGQKFNNPVEALMFYQKYARVWGFSVRHGKKFHTRGKLSGQTWLCSCEGHRRPHKGEQKRASPMETRFGCKAMLQVAVDNTDSKWVVHKFVAEHTHERVRKEHVHHLRSHRGLSEATKADFRFKKNAGLRPCDVINLAVETAGGPEKVGYTRTDGFNFSSKDRRERIDGGDAATALAYLQSKKSVDTQFILRYTLDEKKSLNSLFWADSISVADISCFGELVAFDTTYKKNIYNMPLVIFTGINHHSKTCIFGSALLADETERSYDWALKIVKEMMGGKEVHTIVTDGDLAMRNAIQNIFPNATHRLCSWHLSKNIKSNVKNIPEFEPRWSKLITADYEPAEFEDNWKALVQKCSLDNHQWVSKYLFDRRKEWADTYLRSHFFAELTTTSRCESINGYIARYVQERHCLLDFFIQYDRGCRDMRETEVKLDFESNYGVPPLMSTVMRPLEQSAAKLFSKAAFLKFRHELEVMAGCIKNSQNVVGNLHTYSVTMFDKDKVREVKYNVETNDMECSCDKFKSVGIPCSHMIFVLKEEKVKWLPEQLVLKRWWKNPKRIPTTQQPEIIPDSQRFNVRYGKLQFMATRFFLLGADSDLSFEVAQGVMTAGCDKLEMMKKTPAERGTIVIPKEFEDVLDPKKVLFKGCRKGKGKKRPNQKARRCQRCKRKRHYISTCPERADYVAPFTPPSTDEEEGNNDEIDDDNDDNDDFDDDEPRGQPPKTRVHSRSSTATNGHHGASSQEPPQKRPQTRSTGGGKKSMNNNKK